MKSWQPKIELHINTWSAKLSSERWWPKYIYHFTDVKNAAGVLQHRKICSRTEAQRLGLMASDNAAKDVIELTRESHTAFARFYFRPLTPTQYHNEGITPRNERWHEAHCPVPVFFLFDALDLLSRDAVQFSTGNMAKSGVEFGSSEELFDRIPFGQVFHRSAIGNNEDKDDVIFRRHAEVLVPTALSLDDALKVVVCRSAPERQTLLHLLSPQDRLYWDKKVKLGTKALFQKAGTHVESVSAVDDVITFTFYNGGRFSTAFDATYTHVEASSKIVQWTGRWDTTRALAIRHKDPRGGISTLTLDGDLAYRGPVPFSDAPF